MGQQRLAQRLLAAWLFTVLCLTLTPFGPPRSPRAWYTGTEFGFDFFANIVLYLPLGMLLVRLGVSNAITALGGALVSMTTESAQAFLPGRYPHELDLVANTLGAALGGALSPILWVALMPVCAWMWAQPHAPGSGFRRR